VQASTSFPGKEERTALVVDFTNIARTHWQAMIGNNTSPAIAQERLAGDVIGRIMSTAWKLSPALLILAADSVGKTRRHSVWAAYKGTRARPDPAFTLEMMRMREWFKAMRIPVLYDDGIEADDQIGTIVPRIRLGLPDARIVIWSGDHDMLQLVDESVVFWNGRTDLAVGPADVLASYQVRTDQYVEFLALVGDKDEAPGVPGIGAVGAAKILGVHQTLEVALDTARYRSGREYEALQSHAATARLSLELVTLHRDAPSALAMSLPDAMFGWDQDDADDAAATARRVRRAIPKYSATGKPAPYYEWERSWAQTEGLSLERPQKPKSKTIAEVAQAVRDVPPSASTTPTPAPRADEPKQLDLF
jgi:DNA polymerase-1